MNFDYSEEQQLLAASVRRFVEKQYDFETRRKILASADGCSDSVWSGLADIGLLGLAVPVDAGGFGGGAVDLLGVMEAFGDALIVEPYFSTVLGARMIARAGSDAQKLALLPPIVAGELKVAFAQTELGARYNLAHVATRARKDGGGYVLDGDKRVVLHAPCADRIIVSARTAGGDDDASGISLFVVNARATGLIQNSYRTIDSMPAGDIALHGARVGAIALLCAEAVGAIKYANDATLEYLKTRKQFGVPIGAFQALQHRMVDMVISYEQAKSMASLACAKVDSAKDGAERRRVVSAAKIRIADA